MLDPNHRHLLTDILRAPDGYELTDAIACTYSLDLTALAMVPLLCLGHESDILEDDADKDVGRQLADIECIRRGMSKFTVFCQAGAIHEPSKVRSSYIWLEQRVVEVTIPDRKQRGVFHPKLWLLRFFSAALGVRYRVVVLSRNLTFDRSWDVVASLEGQLKNRDKNRIGTSVPLAEFVAKLGEDIPAVHTMSEGNRERRDLFAQELSKVAFENPDGVDAWKFWPLGLGGSKLQAHQLFSDNNSPFKTWADAARSGSGRQLLVVSPFLGEAAISALAELNQRVPIQLVSSEQTLDRYSYCASEGPKGQKPRQVWAFQGHEPSNQLSGLHAKLWVADDGRQGHIWLGSANATDAAFGRNVEFLLQLTGQKSIFGVDAVMRERTEKKGNERSFRDLLTPYTPPAEPVEDASDQQKRQRELDYLLMDIVAGALSAAVAPQADVFQMCLRSASSAEIEARPITVMNFKPLGSSTSGAVMFDGVELHNLTEFWAVRVSRDELVSSCITRVPTEGMPDLKVRSNAVLGQHLTSMDALAQYLGFLMADSSSSLQAQMRSARRARGTRRAADRTRPLLETLMHALVRQPQILDDVAALLSNLDDGAREWLSEPEIQQLWTAIHTAKLQIEGAIS